MSMPPPGWYPDPSGTPGRRYWDGHDWASNYGTSAVSKRRSRIFLILAIVGPVTALIMFIVMNLLFSGAATAAQPLALNVLGFIAFAVWIGGVVAMVVGIVGLIVHAVRGRTAAAPRGR